MSLRVKVVGVKGVYGQGAGHCSKVHKERSALDTVSNMDLSNSENTLFLWNTDTKAGS